MKHIFAKFSLVSLLLLGACSSHVESLTVLPQEVDNYSPFTQVNTYARPKYKNTVRADWFDSLPENLKSYYAPARGKTGPELFTALHSIISLNNKIRDYGDSKSFMYATADNVNFNNRPGIFDAYSEVFVPGSGGNGGSYVENGDENKDGVGRDFINCEHTWPQSFFNKSLPMVADLHHLQSTLSVPNNRRSHFPFGMATGTIVYTTSGGSKLSVIDKTGKNRTPDQVRQILNLPHEQSAQIMDNEFESVFEPGNAQKGNTARAMMYFYLRYFDQNIRSGEYNRDKFWNSKISTFINWAENVDPVNQEDVRRNEIIFKKQGNRNPFVDIPNLGSLIGEQTMKSDK